jgi:predicted sulfurtransferase
VLVFLLACTPPSTLEPGTQENSSLAVPSEESAGTTEQLGEVPRISKEELIQKLENGDDVLIVDTRYKSEYDRGHIEGAVSAPYSEIVLRKWQPPPDREVVLYCS